MIKKFIDKLLGKSTPGTSGGKPHFGKREEVPASVHGINPELVDRRAADVVPPSSRRALRPTSWVAPCATCCWACAPKTSTWPPTPRPSRSRAVSPRLHHRQALSHRARGAWPGPRARGDRGLHLPRLPRQRRRRAGGGNEKTSKAQLSGMQHAVDASGRVLRDNVWGPQDEDATRRDFTVNAMYYDPVSQIVVDYHKGMQDAKKKTLRMIGDPATRYREDPVRIIRAVRFAAKLSALGFTIEPRLPRPWCSRNCCWPRCRKAACLTKCSSCCKPGHAIATIEQLKKLGMAKGIYPLLDVVVERADTPFVNAALTDTDRRVGEGKPVAPSFLLACVLWETCAMAGQSARTSASTLCRRCRRPSTTCLTSALATCRVAASWRPTCVRSG
jgi:poly(A) polymerase